MTVEAASKEQAEKNANKVLDDSYVEAALEESTKLNVKSALEDNIDYCSLYVDNSGTVHKIGEFEPKWAEVDVTEEDFYDWTRKQEGR